MSNEEILKRFEFDLEMGLFEFTRNANADDGGYYVFKSDDVRNLVEVLITLEYRGGYPVYWDSPIAIYKKSKKYTFFKPDGMYSMVGFAAKTNEIPDYIKEFDKKGYYKCVMDKIMKK